MHTPLAGVNVISPMKILVPSYIKSTRTKEKFAQISFVMDIISSKSLGRSTVSSNLGNEVTKSS